MQTLESTAHCTHKHSQLHNTPGRSCERDTICLLGTVVLLGVVRWPDICWPFYFFMIILLTSLLVPLCVRTLCIVLSQQRCTSVLCRNCVLFYILWDFVWLAWTLIYYQTILTLICWTCECTHFTHISLCEWHSIRLEVKTHSPCKVCRLEELVSDKGGQRPECVATDAVTRRSQSVIRASQVTRTHTDTKQWYVYTSAVVITCSKTNKLPFEWGQRWCHVT